MSDDIIERLNQEIRDMRMTWALETEAFRAGNARLREALKPFADRATAVEAQYKDCYPPRASMVGVEFKYLRAARAAMGESDE